MTTTNLKVVVIGDGAVGKSCLLISYCTGSFPSEYVPTVFDNYAQTVTIRGHNYSLGLWDTGGQEDYDRLRPLSYPQTDIFFICYSVVGRASFENIRDRWIPEIDHHVPNTQRILVACKTDLRTDPRHIDMEREGRFKFVSTEEGVALAKEMKAGFCETSALTRDGVQHCFELATEMCHLNITESAKLKKAGLFAWGPGKSKTKLRGLLRLPPIMPAAGKAPWIEIETSTFADNWCGVLQDPKFHDVTFIVGEQEERKLHAHRLVLSAASGFFNKVLAATIGDAKSQQQQINSIEGFSLDDLNSGKIEGIASIHTEVNSDSTNSPQQTVIQLSADIQAKAFVRVLEFLYTGVPRLPDDSEEAELTELKRVSQLFKLPYLSTICDNVTNEEEFLNPSIGTYLNDEVGTKLKATIFNNQAAHPDVIFNVEGTKIFAHKVVLSARSQVMAAMFSGNFKEGKSVSEITIPEVTSENFLALLEYLYTDHAPIDQMSDIVSLLALADEKGVHRLVNLCELYISKEVERVCEKQIEKAEIDVIGLLNTAKLFNAKQMADWCLHFISTNYLPFYNRQEFSTLSVEDAAYVEEHRWPPLYYLEEVEQYEKEIIKGDGKSKCVVM